MNYISDISISSRETDQSVTTQRSFAYWAVVNLQEIELHKVSKGMGGLIWNQS